MALFFLVHVLWPRGFSMPFEWASLAIGAVATVAIFRFKVGVIPVIAGCAVLGLVWQLAIAGR